MNFQTIGYLERGDYSPSLELAFRLGEFFDLPIEAIFAREPFAPLSRHPARGSPVSSMLILLAGILILFGMLRRGTRRIAALDHPDLDERDIAARNSALALCGGMSRQRKWRVGIGLALLAILLAAGTLADSGG